MDHQSEKNFESILGLVYVPSTWARSDRRRSSCTANRRSASPRPTSPPRPTTLAAASSSQRPFRLFPSAFVMHTLFCFLSLSASLLPCLFEGTAETEKRGRQSGDKRKRRTAYLRKQSSLVFIFAASQKMIIDITPPRLCVIQRAGHQDLDVEDSMLLKIISIIFYRRRRRPSCRR